LAINERAFMALKRVPSNKILHTLTEWAQYPSLLFVGGLWMDMKCLGAFS